MIMMIRKKLLCVTLLLCLLCTPALAQESATIAPAAATVTAVGSASITYAPDTATLCLGVNTSSPTVAEAQTANNDATTAVLAAIRALGVAEADIQTGNLSIQPNYSYDYGKLSSEQTITGYTVDHTLDVTVRDLTQLGTLLDAAIQAGANQSYGLNFSGTGAAAAYDEALKAAAADALRKAGLLCEASGAAAGTMISMEECDSYNGARGVAVAASYDSAAPIQAGVLSVTASVRVTVELAR